MVVLPVLFQALVYQAIPFETVDAVVSEVNTVSLEKKDINRFSWVFFVYLVHSRFFCPHSI